MRAAGRGPNARFERNQAKNSVCEAMPEMDHENQAYWAPPAMPYLELRTTSGSRRPYAPHFHTGLFSVGIILDGRTQVHLGAADYSAEPGDIVLIAPGQVHSCNPVAGAPRSYHMLHLDEAWCRERGGDAFSREGELRTRRTVVRDPELFRLLCRLTDALQTGENAYERIFADLVGDLMRKYCLAASGEMRAPPDKLRPKDALRADMEGKLSVLELARREGVRRETFQRSFRGATGLPPGMYHHCLRLEHARRLLRQGMTIAEAAVCAGYADQSHFHRMFVRFYSLTPGRYKKNMSHSYKK